MAELRSADGRLRREAMSMAAGGFALGLLVLVWPVQAARLFGFPRQHVNSTTVTMARLYAIREASRGVYLIHEARSEHGPRVSTATLNLGIDAFDAAMLVMLAATRPEIRRASVALTLFAGGVSVLWARYLRHVHAAAGARG